MTKILIVEDDGSINDLIKMTLSVEGYQCSQAYSGIEAMSFVDKERYDLVLLDVNLPDIDGFSLYDHLRNIPVIFVTARGDIEDRLEGFDHGAEDYIVKPFELQELIARVKVALRNNSDASEHLCFANVEVDFRKCQVNIGGEKIKLSKQEYELFKALINHKNITLTREQLLELAWDARYEGDLRTVDVHVRRLREKLSLENNIITVYKIGYRLEI